MSSRDVALGRAVTPYARAAQGASAVVEIAGFPQFLYTRAFGDPDILFVPLLDAARESYKTLQRLCSYSEQRASALTLSRTHLASAVLQDSSFSLAARLLPAETVYKVDLDAGTLHVQARLFAVVSRRTSLFMVEVSGKIPEGPYIVRDPLRGAVIIQAEESQLRQHNSFSGWLAPECLRAQIAQQQLGGLDKGLRPPPSKREVCLVVPVAGRDMLVTLKQNSQGRGWDIINRESSELVGTLSPETEGHLNELIRNLQQQIRTK